MNSPKKNLISVVFPVHNEAKILSKQITSFITKVKTVCPKKLEIILVENGSKDTSWKVIKKLGRKYSFVSGIKLDNASYGQAIRKGLLVSKGSKIFIFNVDFYDVGFFKKALNLLKKVDIVIGSKTLPASHDQRSIERRLISYFFNVALRLFLNYPGTDTHGIKAFNKSSKLLEIINNCRAKNELFDTELIIRANKSGFTIIEIPVVVREIRPSRYSLLGRVKSTIFDLITVAWSKYITKMPEVLPVTADDYGLSPYVNHKIRDLASKGKLQVVSILPNMVTKKEAFLLKKLSDKVSYSAHINLIEGKPVSKISKVTSFVDKNGNFFPLYILLTRLFLGKVRLKEIEKEIEVQFARLKKLGLTPSHLNTHQHTHLYPPIKNIIKKIAAKWGIKKIRSEISVQNRLKKWPIKYALFRLSLLLLSIRYGKENDSLVTSSETIVHPGTTYDKLP